MRPRAVTEPNAFSWNSELPSGHNPFWIRDDALSGLGLRSGDGVSVDTRAEPCVGDLVVCEVEDEDGDSRRIARRLVALGDTVRLETVGEGTPIEVPSEHIMLMGVIRGRVRLEHEGTRTVEVALDEN